MRRILCLTFALPLALSLLSACGTKGELETPPPIWGKKDSAQPVQPTPTETTTSTSSTATDTDTDTDTGG